MASKTPQFGRRLFAAGVLTPLATAVLPASTLADEALLDRLSDGTILRDPRRSEHPLGRATGLVDAPVSEVLSILLDFTKYATLLSLREVSLEARSYGRATLLAKGRFFAVGQFEANLEVAISGDGEGKHTIVARRSAGTLDRLDAGFVVERTPSGSRSVLQCEIGIDAPGILPNRMVAERCTDGAVVAVARVRRLIREARSAAT
jgi:hypothetical protein